MCINTSPRLALDQDRGGMVITTATDSAEALDQQARPGSWDGLLGGEHALAHLAPNEIPFASFLRPFRSGEVDPGFADVAAMHRYGSHGEHESAAHYHHLLFVAFLYRGSRTVLAVGELRWQRIRRIGQQLVQRRVVLSNFVGAIEPPLLGDLVQATPKVLGAEN